MKESKIMTGPQVVSGPETQDVFAKSPENIKGLVEQDLRVVVPKIGETAMILQRNATDERDPKSSNYGALKPEAAQQTREAARDYFEKLFQILPAEQRNQVEILIVSSNAPLVAPEGKEFSSPHQRAFETAVEVVKGAQEALQELNIPEKQLLNLSDFSEFAEPEGPVTFEELEALQILSKSPEFVQHLGEKYGTGKKFWVAYETDAEKEVRKGMRAEGVHDIAERMRAFLKLLSQGALERHSRVKDKRLIIWAVSHYDAISPFVKAKVLNRPATDYLPVNAGAGITLEIDKKGKAKTQISGHDFEVKL